MPDDAKPNMNPNLETMLEEALGDSAAGAAAATELAKDAAPEGEPAAEQAGAATDGGSAEQPVRKDSGFPDNQIGADGVYQGLSPSFENHPSEEAPLTIPKSWSGEAGAPADSAPVAARQAPMARRTDAADKAPGDGGKPKRTAQRKGK